MILRIAAALSLLVLGACGPAEPVAQDEPDAVVASTEPGGTASTIEQSEVNPASTTSTLVVEPMGPPAIPALDLDTVVLSNPTSGGGSLQELDWSAVDGGARYDVFMFDAHGDLYWSWSTSGTSVFVGGVETTLANPPGPQIMPGMTWLVLGFDDASSLIAQSEVRAIAP